MKHQQKANRFVFDPQHKLKRNKLNAQPDFKDLVYIQSDNV